VHAALAYYHANRDEIENDIAQSSALRTFIRSSHPIAQDFCANDPVNAPQATALDQYMRGRFLLEQSSPVSGVGRRSAPVVNQPRLYADEDAMHIADYYLLRRASAPIRAPGLANRPAPGDDVR
jgi:hypothetical protein